MRKTRKTRQTRLVTMTAVMAVAAGLAAGCGGAPGTVGSTEATGSTSEAVLGPPEMSFCTSLTGSNKAPIGMRMNIDLPVSYLDPSYPNDPRDPVVQFQTKVASTLGEALPETFSATSQVSQWFAIDMTHMTKEQQDALDILVNLPPWTNTTGEFDVVQAGVFTCKFDIGDWDEYWEDHLSDTTPGQKLRIPPPPYMPTMILAYDPCGNSHVCDTWSPGDGTVTGLGGGVSTGATLTQ